MYIRELFENKDDNEKILDIIRNSKFWQVNKNNPKRKFLYHRSKALTQKYQILNVNRKRGPKDTLLMIHNYINNNTKKEYGVGIRNLFFASGIPESIPPTYGSLYVAIPLGDYRLFYSSGIHFDFTDDFHASITESFSYTFVDAILEDIEDHTDLTQKQREDIYDGVENSVKSNPKTFKDFVNNLKTNLSDDIKKNSSLNNHIMKSIKDYVNSLDQYIKSIKVEKKVSKVTGELMIDTEKMLLVEDDYFETEIEPKLNNKET